MASITRLLGMVIFVSTMMTSCNDSDFAGGTPSERRPAEEEPSPPESADQAQQTPNLGNTVNGQQDFNDFFQGIDNTPNNAVVVDNSVVFGEGQVFRLGDGQATQSSCAGSVNSMGLSGRKYYFEFYVQENNTQTSISVNEVCGVDYADSNFATLYLNGQQIESQPLLPGMPLVMFRTTFLNTGSYRIEIETRETASHDADDFVVGDLRIRGSSPITRGNFGVSQ